MSLDLRIRPRYPRYYRRRRGRLFWWAVVALALAVLVAWQRGWHPQDVLAYLDNDSAPIVSATLPIVAAVSQQVQTSAVVMVDSSILDTPHSDAYTADLHMFAGKDDIPWPNVDGRTRVERYTVQDGDTLWAIADRFGLDLDTLRWSNRELELNPDVLAVGTDLLILPVAGVYHTVSGEDTIDSIAAQYGVAVTDISDYPPNGLYPPYILEPGQGLIVPYGRKDIVQLPRPSLSAASAIAWPLVGTVSQGFEPAHPAVDIAAPYGSTIYAADDGTITYADWAQTGYGYTIIMDHGDGRSTWYNHLKGTLLEAGNFVPRGTPIGEVGSTGHSSGPHLHFELRLNGEAVDPTAYLPGTVPQ
jgi:murein DD-endopeptidase MepM/ murein hydrolase activator NlpD